MPKILPFNIPKPDSSSLTYQVDHVKRFYDKLHQHEEIQLSIILKGEGDLVVGDKVGRFEENDIFLIGSNVSHLFRSDKTLNVQSHMLTLFFTRESFGADFFQIEETKVLRKLIDSKVGGWRIRSNKARIKGEFLRLAGETKLGRLIVFLEIMNLISKSRREQLSETYLARKINEDQGVRMSAIMNLVMNNFQREISLSEVAEVANMTENAFCRFFKLSANKTFVQFLNEVRLEHACNLLQKNRDLSVVEVAAVSGFNNISNFNRQFKAYKKMTPSSYRRQF